MSNEEELFATIEYEMSLEDLPCESEAHSSSPFHAGIGEWYLSLSCPSCGISQVVLSCDRFKEYFPIYRILTGHVVVKCNKCDSMYLYRETLFSAERRVL